MTDSRDLEVRTQEMRASAGDAPLPLTSEGSSEKGQVEKGGERNQLGLRTSGKGLMAQHHLTQSCMGFLCGSQQPSGAERGLLVR